MFVTMRYTCSGAGSRAECCLPIGLFETFDLARDAARAAARAAEGENRRGYEAEYPWLERVPEPEERIVFAMSPEHEEDNVFVFDVAGTGRFLAMKIISDPITFRPVGLFETPDEAKTALDQAVPTEHHHPWEVVTGFDYRYTDAAEAAVFKL